MDFYKILWKRSAEQDLRNIDCQKIPLIIKSIEKLVNNPFPPKTRKLKGSERNYRIRVGDYRVVYQIDVEAKIITIYHIRHRREAYRR